MFISRWWKNGINQSKGAKARGRARRLSVARFFEPMLEALEPRWLPSTFVVTNTGDSSVLTSGSLRAAILNANTSPGSIINFNIGASGVVETITPTSALPTITASVTIDGTTESGYTSSPLINLNGAGLSANGLQLTASNTTIRGLAIGGFGQAGLLISGGATGDLIANDFVGTNAAGTVAAANSIGIEISSSANNTLNTDLISGNTGNGVTITGSGSTGNLVEGDYIGTDVTGTLNLGNANDGVYVQGSNNTIGAGNLISGDGSSGVELEAGANLVEGNLIGTNAAGTGALGNAYSGVYVGAANNTIGGTTAAARNVISGNGTAGTAQGIDLAASNNLVEGNYIGTDVTGTLALGNNGQGIWDTAGPNTVGGTVSGAGNLISGNSVVGLWFYSGNGNLAEGNYIGTDVTGTKNLGNTFSGIQLQSNNNTVGGITAAARNLVSGNGFGTGSSGITVLGSGNLVEGDTIGTNVTGTGALPNDNDGVFVNAASNTIGGAAAGAGNLISGNAGRGVEINGAGATANLVEGNYIGTDVTGTLALGNSGDGVAFVTAGNNNIVGGMLAGAGNVIAGNGRVGVWVDASSNELIAGNLIGTNAAGTAALGNGLTTGLPGVLLTTGSTNDTLGGTTAAASNVISGNGSEGGVLIQGTADLIEGNYIGTNAAGATALANAGNGITVNASGNSIGGATATARNLISGNSGIGISISGSGNLIEGNTIGTNAAETAALPNSFGVIVFSGADTIGGSAAGAGNLISGNTNYGVDLQGDSGNVVEGNSIGTKSLYKNRVLRTIMHETQTLSQ